MFWDNGGGVSEYVAALSVITVTSGLEGGCLRMSLAAMPQIVRLQCLSSCAFGCAMQHTTQQPKLLITAARQTFVNATPVHTCSTVGANLANIAFCQSS